MKKNSYVGIGVGVAGLSGGQARASIMGLTLRSLKYGMEYAQLAHGAHRMKVPSAGMFRVGV